MEKLIYDKCKQCVTTFAKLQKQYRVYVTDKMNGYDLSPNEIDVLSYVTIDQPQNAITITRKCNVSKSLVSRSIKLLQKSEYLNVEVSPIDKREILLSLAPKGIEVKNKLVSVQEEFIKTTFRNLDIEAVEVLSTILNLLHNNLLEDQKKN